MHVQYCRFVLVHLQACAYAYTHGGGFYALPVCAKVCTSDFQGEQCERSSMLLLFCRVFITLRGPALIMHGYTAPQTSQCFTGGEEKRHCKMTGESAISHTVCQASYLLVNSANNSALLNYLPCESPIHLCICSLTYSSL